MSGTMYGYARVSTRTQKEDRQVAALQEFGVAPKHITVEKQSGKNFDRPLYQRLVQTFLPGDVLVVKSIDRLGRNYGEILDQWSYITKTRETAIVVLDMPLLDTREALRSWRRSGGAGISPPPKPEKRWGSPEIPLLAGQWNGAPAGGSQRGSYRANNPLVYAGV